MATATPATLNLSDTYVFLEDGGSAPRIHVTEAFWRDLMSGTPRSPEAVLVAEGSGWLTAVYPMTEDSRAWEMHPNGDELLVMLSGGMDVVLHRAGRDETFELQHGMAFIVPKGVWHRQVIRDTGKFFAVTYGKGTEHRPIE